MDNSIVINMLQPGSKAAPTALSIETDSLASESTGITLRPQAHIFGPITFQRRHGLTLRLPSTTLDISQRDGKGWGGFKFQSHTRIAMCPCNHSQGMKCDCEPCGKSFPGMLADITAGFKNLGPLIMQLDSAMPGPSSKAASATREEASDRVSQAKPRFDQRPQQAQRDALREGYCFHYIYTLYIYAQLENPHYPRAKNTVVCLYLSTPHPRAVCMYSPRYAYQHLPRLWLCDADPISGLRGMPPTGNDDLYPQGFPGSTPGFASGMADPSMGIGPGPVLPK